MDYQKGILSELEDNEQDHDREQNGEEKDEFPHGAATLTTGVVLKARLAAISSIILQLFRVHILVFAGVSEITSGS